MMNTMMTGVVSNPELIRLGLTLVHFLWQGTLVSFALAILLMLLRGVSANLRYKVACVALFAMAAMPLVTHVALNPAPQVRSGAAGVPHAAHALNGNQFIEVQPTTPVGQSPRPPSVASPTLGDKLNRFLEPTLPWMALGWFIGVVTLSLRLLGGCIQAERLKRRHVRPLGAEWERRLRRLQECLHIDRAVTLLQSSAVAAPVLIGWFRPVILFPVATLVGLPGEQLEAVLAHELAHVKRRDYLVHVLQTGIEVALFYHPAVWWVSRQVSIEREHACDDLAASVCGDPVSYANALTELARLTWNGPRLALAATDGTLFTRIRRLVSTPASDAQGNTAWLPGGLIAACAALLMAVTIHFPAKAAIDAHASPQTVEITSAAPAAPAPPERLPSVTDTATGVTAKAGSETMGVALTEFSRLGDDAPPRTPSRNCTNSYRSDCRAAGPYVW